MEDTELDPLAPTRATPGAGAGPLERSEPALAAALQTGDPLEGRALREDVRSKLFGTTAAPVRIGRFAIERKLGEGGMGAVYLASDPELERQVAIKLLRNEALEGTQGRARLKREAKALAKLADPHVVHVYEVGEHDGQVFVAMEYIEGQTLRAWLRTKRSIDEIVEVFGQAVRGLAAAHDQGLVHRDFKPDNLLVGRDGRARVVDFGLARPDGSVSEAAEVDLGAGGSSRDHSGPVGGLETLTATGTVMGTPAYMAPEQFEGRPSDARTDQFALCVALHEALYGRRPFEGDTMAALGRAVCEGRLPDPLGDRPVPEHLQRLLRRGLAVDPEARYGSMRELGDAMHAAAPRRTARWPWLAVPVTLAIAAAIPWLATREPPPPPAVPPTPEPPPSGDALALAELGGKEVITAAAARAIRCDENTCRVERRFLRGLRATPEMLQTQARAVVQRRGDEVEGLRLYGVTRDSLPGRLGLANGDFIVQIGELGPRGWISTENVLDALADLDTFEVHYRRHTELQVLRIDVTEPR